MIVYANDCEGTPIDFYSLADDVRTPPKPLLPIGKTKNKYGI
jgi:hypothetical protein